MLICQQFAARRSERRLLILDTFDDIPDTILRTQRCYELFPDNLLLRDRALAVYLDLLSMIEAMMTCMIDRKICKNIFKTPSYEQSDLGFSDSDQRQSKRSIRRPVSERQDQGFPKVLRRATGTSQLSSSLLVRHRARLYRGDGPIGLQYGTGRH